MSETQVPASTTASPLESRAMVLVVYGLYLFALLSCGIAGIAGVIVAYIKRDEAHGTLWQSHFENQVSAFWGWFGLAIAGVVMIPLLGLGFVVLAIAFVWFLYRTIKGLLRALENQPYT